MPKQNDTKTQIQNLDNIINILDKNINIKYTKKIKSKL
jgi:hypothetical protein